jgi:uncharacterized membrane protein
LHLWLNRRNRRLIGTTLALYLGSGVNFFMAKRVFIFRMALGGAVAACLAGVVLGALSGVVYGLFLGDLTYGLDGAILAGALAWLPGALVGWLLGRREERERRRRDEMWITTQPWEGSESPQLFR